MNGQAKNKGENVPILSVFPLQSLHLRRGGEITIHADSLSPLPCASLDPNHRYSFIFFFFNSGTLETNRA